MLELSFLLFKFASCHFYGTEFILLFLEKEKCLHAGALVMLHCVLSSDFIFLCLFLKRGASGKLHL